MFRHIRSKLIAAFAVPLAILVAVAGLEALSSLGQINSVDQQTSLASASVGPGGVVQALQTERIYAVLSILAATNVNNLAPALEGLTPTSDNLYQSVTKLEAQDNADVSSFEHTVRNSGSQAQKIYGNAFAALNNLAHVRSYWLKAGLAATAATPTTFISNYAPLVQETYQGYTNIIDTLVNDTAAVPFKISDPTLRTGVETLYTSLQETESQWTVVEDLFTASMSSGATQKTDINSALEAWGANQTLAQRLDSYGTGKYSDAVFNLNQSSVNSSLQLDLGFMDQGLVPPLPSVLQAFTEPACVRTATEKCIATSVTPTAFGDNQIAAVVNSRASSLRDSAVEQAITFGAVGALGTILGLLLVVLVSRSVSRPLVDLAHQAEELATTTLPATVHAILEASNAGAEAPKIPRITVNSRDEVAGMAKALEAVNKTAVELAAGQAALRRNLADAFVNLGRRNQNLVTRQLEYISEIELKEADPESLEELFRLDHLATRMRRNAESLLILAGSGPARQWSAAVPAMDVARAASAEVEDYKRLRLHHFDPAQITGAVTTDLVHILAELIENALTFSPPGSPVDVYGRFLEGGYVIVIVDSGIGMSADDLETANRRLEGEGSDDEVPGRYLGHFVAGRLASRHSIAISLQASHSGGLVARVKIPAPLIEEPVPDLSAVAEVRSVPASAGLEPAPVVSAEPVVVNSTAVIEGRGDAGSPAGAPVAPIFDHSGSSGAGLNGSPGHGEAVLEQPSTTSFAPAPGGTDLAPAADYGLGSGGLGAGYADFTSAGAIAAADETAEDADEALAQWAGEMAAEPAWDQTEAEATVDAEQEPDVDDYAGVAEPEAEAGVEAEAELDAAAPVEAAPAPAWQEGPVSYEDHDVATEAAEAELAPAEPFEVEEPEPGAEPVTEAAEVFEPAAEAPQASATEAVAAPVGPGTPDLGLHSPLAAPLAGSVAASTSASAWDHLPGPDEAPAVGPAAQARTTADGLRKLTRRVPGATLPTEDESLRRATPTSTTQNPLGLSGALSQYLSATANDGRSEKEHNAK